jgi:peroxiredoxin
MVLRKRHRDLQVLGVQVAAISVDHLPALRVFDAALARFPFPLAADWHRGICRSFGVLDEESQVSRRVLMLCDYDGRVSHVVDQFDPDQPLQMEELIAAARAAAAQAAGV